MIDEKKLIEDVKAKIYPEKFGERSNATDVISGVLQVISEQPKTDWIPCEAELPPKPKENPLYENKPLQVYLVSVKSGEEPFRAFWNGKNFTDGWSKLDVEAWMPLPQPYKKEGAESEK